MEVLVCHVNFILSIKSISQQGLGKGVSWLDLHFKMSSLTTLENELKRGKNRNIENQLDAIAINKDDGGLDQGDDGEKRMDLR